MAARRIGTAAHTALLASHERAHATIREATRGHLSEDQAKQVSAAFFDLEEDIDEIAAGNEPMTADERRRGRLQREEFWHEPYATVDEQGRRCRVISMGPIARIPRISEMLRREEEERGKGGLYHA